MTDPLDRALMQHRERIIRKACGEQWVSTRFKYMKYLNWRTEDILRNEVRWDVQQKMKPKRAQQ